MRTWQVRAGEDGTLLDFLAQSLACSRRQAKQILDGRHALVNGRRVWMAHHVLKAGDRVEVAGSGTAARTGAPAPDIPVLYEDPDYLVVNKPAGLLSNGPDSVETCLQTARGESELRAVHRLDRDTTGCLLLARHPRAFDAAVALFRSHDLRKTYQAIVLGTVTRGQHTIRHAIDGQSATTHWRVLAASREASHLALAIETGRTHQIRKHLAAEGFPVLGDRAYTGGRRLAVAVRGVERQMLHAAGLAFTHPGSQQPIRVDAPIPQDFRRWLARLHLHARSG